MNDSHVSAILLKDDGLWHGAYFINRPTPSGCTRYVLQYSHKDGHTTSEAAAKQMHELFPDAAYAAGAEQSLTG